MKKKLYSWSEFTGQSIKSMEEYLKKEMNIQGLDFLKSSYQLSRVQAIVLGGGNKGTVYYIKTNLGDIRIIIFPALADPITRLTFSFMATADRIHKMENICVLKILYSEGATNIVRKLFVGINKKLKKPLWDITHHPRFQTALLLDRRVRRNWKKWLME